LELSGVGKKSFLVCMEKNVEEWNGEQEHVLFQTFLVDNDRRSERPLLRTFGGWGDFSRFSLNKNEFRNLQSPT
jgi:hypothetical protein